MLETVSDQNFDVALFSHKIRSKDKSIKRDSKIRVKYKENKETQKYESSMNKQKNTKNNNVLKM